MSGRGKAQKSLELIDAAREILEEIQPASVRAVCYRLFVAGLIANMISTVPAVGFKDLGRFL